MFLKTKFLIDYKLWVLPYLSLYYSLLDFPTYENSFLSIWKYNQTLFCWKISSNKILKTIYESRLVQKIWIEYVIYIVININKIIIYITIH